MEEFLENIKLLINTLGFKIFEEIREDSQTIEEQINTFYINAARGANAKGQLTNEGFVVLKNSEIAGSVTKSFPKNWLNLRQSMKDDGIIQKINNSLVFVQDYLFSSPSASVAIVICGNECQLFNRMETC